MKLNPKFIGSFVFIRAIRRKIEINEKNIPILLQNGIHHVFMFNDTLMSVNINTSKDKKKPAKRTKKDETK